MAHWNVSYLFVPGWIALALVIRYVRRDRSHLLIGHALLGLAFWALAVLGFAIWANVDPPFRTRFWVGFGVFGVGVAAFQGWLVSPGGMRIAITPFFAIDGKSFKEDGPEGEKSVSVRYWSRPATLFALLMLAMWGGMALMIWRTVAPALKHLE